VNRPGLQLVGVDFSLPALRIARENARRHGVLDRIDFVQADLLSSFPRSSYSQSPERSRRGRIRWEGLFDLICANLPYIPTQTLAGLEVSRYEPRPALDGGADGLELIRRFLLEAPGRLAPGGLALLEIEAGQGEAAAALARQAFPTAEVAVLKDMAGHDRVLAIKT
jgi:release factor glutamine methyltransferase